MLVDDHGLVAAQREYSVAHRGKARIGSDPAPQFGIANLRRAAGFEAAGDGQDPKGDLT